MNKRLVMLTVAVLLIIGAPAVLLGADPTMAKTRTVTKRYPVAVTCQVSISPTCYPFFTVLGSTAGKLTAEFTANPNHCTPVNLRYAVNGRPVSKITPYFKLEPGGTTGRVSLGPRDGRFTLMLYVGDAAGGGVGCPDGPLTAYEGTLTVQTTKRVKRR